METPVFAGVFIFFAAPRVSGAPGAADPIIESLIRYVSWLSFRCVQRPAAAAAAARSS